MPLPTDDLIIWASSDVNLPNLAGPNKVKPIDDLILKGWDFKQKPAADEFNYILNNIGQHISYLEEGFTYNFIGDVTGSVVSSGSEDFSVNLQVVDNSHNHTSANISDATSLNTPNMVVRRDINGDVAVRYVVGGLVGNAFTATTLETPRTINGTSFNGSANITTNSWGYSRNLAFTGFATGSGNVDGSGNVSIELSMGSGFTTSKATNGYTYLPNGMIFQWGTFSLGAGGSANQIITLPLTFPVAGVLAIASPSYASAGATEQIGASITSTSTISLIKGYADNNARAGTWFAIGY